MIFQAPWLNHFTGTPMIGFPIFELDEVPEYDLAILRGLDFVLQASRWGKGVLEKHGFKNVHVVPGGYDPALFHRELTLEQKLERIQRQGISFVHVGRFEPRKASGEILHSFLRACDEGREKVNFCFHACNPFDDRWFEKSQKILLGYGFTQEGPHFIRGNTRVLVPQERFKADPGKLYQISDFGIWASKGEGWNLPLIECLACGLPCLTTNNTGQADFIRENVYPDELIVKSHQNEATRVGSWWWPIDEQELTDKIKAMIRDPEKYLKLENQCFESIKDFTWENSARKLGEVIKIIT